MNYVIQTPESKIRRYATSYMPSRNSSCPCGSGEKYKRCCGDSWEIGSEAYSLYLTETESSNFRASLKYLRAHVTWYRICHVRHTVPFMKADRMSAEDILRIDIEALFGHCEHLVALYTQLAMNDQLDSVISRLEGAIDDERWKEKIQYLYVVAALGAKWNVERARKVIRLRCDFDSVKDFGLMTIIFDICNSDLGSLEALRFVQRIIHCADRAVDKLHYRVARGLRLLMLEEKDGIAREVSDAIEEFRASVLDKELSIEEADWMSHALCVLATISKDDKAVEDAELETTRLLLRTEFNSAGKASVYRRLAELCKARNEYGKAAAHFQTAYQGGLSEADLVFASECMMAHGEYDTAEALFRSVNYHKLDTAGKLDYALSAPGFALRSDSRIELRKAKNLLLAANFREPYFRRQQLEIIRIIERAEVGNELNGSPESVGRFVGFLRALAKYFELKPNFMGVGINLNAVISDAVDDKLSMHEATDGLAVHKNAERSEVETNDPLPVKSA